MTIYSWNMLFSNNMLDSAFAFIRDSDADIFCLQEVPETFLERLRTLPYHLAETVDVVRLLDKVQTNYLVILSRYPIEHRGDFSFPEYWHRLPPRTRLFVRLMRPFSFSAIRNRNGFFVDIRPKGSLLRLFNLHLILAQPAWRLREFERAMLERDPAIPTLVCGDFNILESPRVSILNWMLGGPLHTALLCKRERTTIEERFVAHDLVNALARTCTHPLSRSQLDHILVSNSLAIKRAEVVPDRAGSDHHPIFVELK